MVHEIELESSETDMSGYSTVHFTHHHLKLVELQKTLLNLKKFSTLMNQFNKLQN